MKKITLRMLLIIIASLALMALVACGGTTPTTETEAPTAVPEVAATEAPAEEAEAPPEAEVTGRVGIVLPTREEPRWIQDEARFREALEAAGYEVEILFSQGDSAIELANVEQLITRGIEVLIITPHDGTAAAAAAEAARNAGVKVISYDRLIRDTDAVDYYVTFDSIAVGEAQAQYLVDKATGTDNPLYLYAGAATDNNAFLFFEGAWNILQPKIADGTFRIVNSSEAVALQDKAELTRDEMGQIIGQVTTNWDFNTAKSLAEANLTAAPAADKGDVFILAPNDGTARAIADAFAADADVSSFVVTGQDAEIASVQYIIDGLQSMTVLKDVRTLVGDAIAAAVAYLTGGEPEQTNAYDNGVIEVPAKPSEVIAVDQSNVQAAIIDSGYWDASEFTGLDTMGEAPEITGRVGIVLPTREEPRWIQDEARFREALEAAGYEVEILFSQGDSAIELANVEQLITRGIEVLIITPHDGTAAAAAAEAARNAGVKVISYDRLIRDTDAVDYYVTFDSIAVGEAQAQYLVDKATGTDNPLYLYAGAATDNNAFLFFEGAWNILQPKIADGTFRIVNSSEAVALQDKAELTRDEMGQIIGQVTTNWDFNTAKSLAEANLTAAPAADKGDVFILAPNDGTARAIADAFAADADVSSFVVTGQDAEIASVQYIIDGLQSMTVLKDVRTLVGDAIAAAVAYLTGGEPEQTNAYDNGVIEVPAKPSEVIAVDQSNVQAAIIDSGYWDAGEFTGLDD
jgi:putative multiple sugar transport system substrate-binding protein